MDKQTAFLLGVLLCIHQASGLWLCTSDSQCASDLEGSVCNGGICECGPGTQAVAGGTKCMAIAPYHTSDCVEDFQCSRLFSGFECRPNENNDGGNCFCQSGFHYLYGRCWKSLDFGAACTRDEECLGVVRDPFSLSCNVTCGCAAGYVERQRGDCRIISHAVGEGCVLDQDCQFPNGVCDLDTFSCIESGETEAENFNVAAYNNMKTTQRSDTRVQRVVCSATNPCASPFECSSFGVCICPTGYYESDDGRTCLAELGSPSQPEQCVGLLALVIDGICSCRPNFFYDENMRDCIRVTRRFTDACVQDTHCHTFGPAARCGAPQTPWGIRTCECDPDVSVWWANRNMCGYFVGIGEICELDSECLAGDREIPCIIKEDGLGYCTCPDGFEEMDGLCLTSGLSLGESCQHRLECAETAHSTCDGVCTCDEGFQQVGDMCAPSIGTACTVTSDCAIENTICKNSTSGFSCECADNFVPYDNICYPAVPGYNASCNVSAQCIAALGEASACLNDVCTCIIDNHYRDGGCWPVTGLFESCSRTSQCFLNDGSERTVCRNSQCQCQFEYPFSEEKQTCLSSSASYFRTSLPLILTLLYFGI